MLDLLNARNFEAKENTASFDQVRLKNKIVPLSNGVFRFLDHYEAGGELGFLPQARPYTKITVLRFLEVLIHSDRLSEKEKAIVQNYISDLSRESNGFHIYKQGTQQGFAVVELGAETSIRPAAGHNATWSMCNLILPYLSDGLGDHLTFRASMGASIEILSPDLFYQSYTKDQKVQFPYQPEFEIRKGENNLKEIRFYI